MAVLGDNSFDVFSDTEFAGYFSWNKKMVAALNNKEVSGINW